ncbi:MULTISPECIES: Lsr2 family protein [unclassified Arthrobacter]|uniref:histone-like nucleoid-structuring protein Lsr2 n=1 Tax=unclassified Arthrobacter TaxID=235627 RepID=UPI001C858367|nr:Lsr2 family protein [Arthrobacter sp. MAHUQ-56]MBX7443369.1 Lsr2 family protein [Arthrobacter sp. MAHUQ-56]
MVTRIISILEDDLDGSEAAETVRFSLDGRSYEIDLNSAHARQFRASLLRYIRAGRKVSSKGRRPLITGGRIRQGLQE